MMSKKQSWFSLLFPQFRFHFGDCERTKKNCCVNFLLPSLSYATWIIWEVEKTLQNFVFWTFFKNWIVWRTGFTATVICHTLLCCTSSTAALQLCKITQQCKPRFVCETFSCNYFCLPLSYNISRISFRDSFFRYSFPL